MQYTHQQQQQQMYSNSGRGSGAISTQPRSSSTGSQSYSSGLDPLPPLKRPGLVRGGGQQQNVGLFPGGQAPRPFDNVSQRTGQVDYGQNGYPQDPRHAYIDHRRGPTSKKGSGSVSSRTSQSSTSSVTSYASNSDAGSELGDDVDIDPEVVAGLQAATIPASMPSPKKFSSSASVSSMVMGSSSGNDGKQQQQHALLSGDEAIQFTPEKSFSFLLDIPVSWETREHMNEAMNVIIPAEVFLAQAMHHAQVLYADELSQIEQYVPAMSSMKRWLPFKVSLVEAKHNNVTSGYGLRWENHVMLYHNNRRWGTNKVGIMSDNLQNGDEDYDVEDPEEQRHAMMWFSVRHDLHSTYRPAEPLLLSDLTPYMNSLAFRLPFIDPDKERRRNVSLYDDNTDPSQKKTNYMRVRIPSATARVLQEEIPSFGVWLSANPGAREKDSFLGVPESICDLAHKYIVKSMDAFVAFKGLLEDQHFRVVPLPRMPTGYTVAFPDSYNYAGHTVDYSVLPRYKAEAVMGGDQRYTFRQGQDCSNYVIPAYQREEAEKLVSAPSDIIFTLMVEVCPCIPVVDHDDVKEIGFLSMANLGSSSSKAPPLLLAGV